MTYRIQKDGKTYYAQHAYDYINHCPAYEIYVYSPKRCNLGFTYKRINNKQWEIVYFPSLVKAVQFLKENIDNITPFC